MVRRAVPSRESRAGDSHSRYMVHAMANREMFLVRISVVFLERTRPDSSMAKPAAIHITNAPHTKKSKVLRADGEELSTAWDC